MVAALLSKTVQWRRDTVRTMNSADKTVLGKLLHWLQQGEDAWLCTIVATAGSSPRPVGAMLACNQRGELVGSLSGGCIEDDFLEKLASGDLPAAKPGIFEYGVTAEENERLGLPCGGRLKVLVEPVVADSHWPEILGEILQHMDERRCIQRRLDLLSGSNELHERDRYQQLQWNKDEVLQCFGPRYQLFLVGAGQLSRVLAELALAMDYQVLVCDPRDHLRQQWDLPGVELIAGMPDDAVRKYANDPMSIIITLTHDPRIDDMALMEALTTEAFYVGALGSARTSAARRKRLLQLDITEQQLDRLHAPVGLSIGSKTPHEIAIAILAQLTECRSESLKGEL
jgi:xanthine dehydrogenase accessory factor